MSISAASIILKSGWPTKPSYTEKDYPDLEGKVYLVTGATGGIGLITAQLLAAQKAKVYLHGRSTSKMEAAIEKIKAEVPDAELSSVLFDLADLETIKPGIAPILAEPKLDGIILNAGIALPETGAKTKQGYNMQMGTNNIGHHLVMRLLNQVILKQSEDCRIVWVASLAHVLSPRTGVSWNSATKSPMDNEGTISWLQYAQSKAINIMQSYQWSKQNNAGSNIISVAIHPGVYITGLYTYADWATNYSVKLGCSPQKYGAYTELFALLNPQVATVEPPIYVSPYGNLWPNMIRSDVLQSTTGKVGEDVWEYLDKQTDQYI